ncbi:DUF6912 family protein, partial [Streptomyces fradiae]|uniref:DUF6912 family protein n=1 Tax=Streptomyces fradiae TaxID=1906 RepID=UPI0036CD4ED8
MCAPAHPAAARAATETPPGPPPAAGAAASVPAGAAARGAADRGYDHARFTVDSAEDHELLWYGVQE